MPTYTTNYNLALYNSTTDQSETFLNYRLAMSGPDVSSNVMKLETALTAQDTRLDSLEQTRGAIYISASNAGGNAYISSSSNISAYAENAIIIVKLDVTQTGTTTLDINSLGSRSLMKYNAAGTVINLESNDLIANREYLFRYDGTRWVWVNQETVRENGWIDAGETWTYASATTFTISGDKTGKYQLGDKIKLSQTTVKYFYIVGVSYSAPNTTITIAGGSDYVLVSAAITLNYYAKDEYPLGFPGLFNFTPVWTSGSDPQPAIGNGTLTGRFEMRGKMIRYSYRINMNTSTTFGSSYWLLSLPVSAAASGSSETGFVGCFSGTAGQFGNGFPTVHGDLNKIFFDLTTVRGNITSTAPFTWNAATTNSLRGFIDYQIAA